MVCNCCIYRSGIMHCRQTSVSMRLSKCC